jgi:hypothetical protein
MYNLSAYSSIIHQQTSVLAIYSALLENNLISKPKIFFDKRLIEIKAHIPLLHAWHLCSETQLVLTDNSVYDIADVFPSNKFICIDIPCRHNASNVDHYSIEPFAKSQDAKHTLGLLLDILNKKDYEQYVEIQQTV